MEVGLKQKAASGIIWSSLQKFGTMGISFVSNIILARLLSPEDYGCIGMLMIFILVANTFIDGGFGSALIQKKEPTQKDYSTIFYWNLLLSIVLYFALFVSAPLIARFYNLPLLSPVLQVQGLVLILNSLSIIQQNRLRKQLLFKKLAIVSIISALLSLVITIYLAYIGWGVWALVAQQLLMSGFNAVLYWIVGKWNPSFVFSRQSFKELFGFGGFILLSNFINTLCNNVQGILIGKFFSPITMGFYAQARKLEEVASTSLSSVIDQVSYPVLAEVQNDKNKLAYVLKKLITAIAFFSFPIMLALIVIAEPLITLLYSDKWTECVPYFQILCIAGLAISLQNVNYYAVAAIGKSKTLFNWTLIKRLLGIILIVVGFIVYGIWGLLLGMMSASYIMYIINAVLVSKYIGYKLTSQFKDLLPTLLISSISFLISYFSPNITMSLIADMFLSILIFALSYIILTYLFEKDKILMIKNIVLSYRKK